MRKIILASLFFCLTMTTVLAQVATINIETPNSNGLSNNQVDDFDVHTDGTILNNSAAGGTAQLGNTAVTGNSNITAGSEASLILFQVTGSSGSDLDGAIEVFGAEAGIIIANPNGIDCDGCGFINTSKVDLVTGTANFSGDDLTGFSIDGNSTLTVSGSGFLSDAVADELKLESQNISINAQVRANNSLEIIVNDYTQSGAIDVIGNISIQVTSEASLDDNASIQSSNLFFSAYNFYSQADLTITYNATFDIGNDFNNGFYLDATRYDGGDISADNFNVTAGNYFYNWFNSTINADSFNVTTEQDFFNYATINVNDFNVTTERYFYNWFDATINADNFNVITREEFSNYDNTTINADNFNVTTKYFENQNHSTINADNFNVTARNEFDNRDSATINADNFNLTAGDDFYNRDSATINADNFNLTAGNDFYNRDSATINADNFNLTAGDDFYNEDGATITANDFYVTAGDLFINRYDANINANNFNIVVEDDFFNVYNATINANSFNVTARNDFYNYTNATISANDVSISANSFINSHTEGDGSITADTLILSVAGDFDYSSDFLNNGNIDATNQNFIARNGDFTNNTSIVLVGNLEITASNFINTGGNITADSLILSIAGDFDYMSFRILTLSRNGDFTNNTSIVLEVILKSQQTTLSILA